MISYETYKMLHLATILIFFASLGFVASSAPFFQKRLGKILAGLISFFILVAGMGLIARLGFKHGEAFPLWLNFKVGAWVVLNALFIYLFKSKTPALRRLTTSLIVITGLLAVWVVLNKPV